MKKLLIHPEELSIQWIDRMVSQGVEILGLHPVGGDDAHASAARLLEQLETEAFRSLIDYACQRGLQIEYELHAASFLLPAICCDPEHRLVCVLLDAFGNGGHPHRRNGRRFLLSCFLRKGRQIVGHLRKI